LIVVEAQYTHINSITFHLFEQLTRSTSSAHVVPCMIPRMMQHLKVGLTTQIFGKICTRLPYSDINDY